MLFGRFFFGCACASFQWLPQRWRPRKGYSWRGWLNPHDLHAAKWQPHKAPPWPSARGQGKKTVCSLAYIRVFVYVVGGIAAVAAGAFAVLLLLLLLLLLANGKWNEWYEWNEWNDLQSKYRKTTVVSISNGWTWRASQKTEAQAKMPSSVSSSSCDRWTIRITC